MKISACPKCGSRRIFQGRMEDGVLTGYTSREVCRDCGYRGSPIIFDSEKEYKKFLEELKTKDEKEESSYEYAEDKLTDLTDKEKEIVDFLKEIDEENKDKKDTEFREKQNKFPKNLTASMGFGLLVIGILVSFLSFYFTILLILVGISLIIIGFITPSEEELQKKYREKIKKLPKIAGVLLVLNGLVNGLLYFTMLGFVLMYDRLPMIYGPNNFNDIMLLMGKYQPYFIAFLSIEILFCIFLIVGGIFALLKKRWGIATLASILGLFLIPIFYIPVIISFIVLVLLTHSRFIFNR